MSEITTVPTTIFTGFLGSGKTTIIANLIDKLQNNGQQVIYIKNEIGNENIDAQLMKGKHIKTKELLNGCICCTLVGPFVHAIDEIVERYKPDRIIIEASGAADPAALAMMIDSHPKLKRDGVISIIDVINFDGYSDLSITAQNQTKFTDLIVFNKIEQVDLARKQAVVGYVRELNTHSPIVEAPQAQLALDVAFGSIDLTDLNQLLSDEGFTEQADSNSPHHPHDDHLHQDGIESFALKLPVTLSNKQLHQILDELPPAVYRVKGLLKMESGNTVLLNKVGRRTIIEESQTASTDKLNVLVLIGFRIKQYQEQLEELVETLVK